MQAATLRTDYGERRDFEPRAGREEIIDLDAACSALPARDFDGERERGLVNWCHRVVPTRGARNS